MVAFLLVTLFAVVAAASALTIADAVMRARCALRHLRGELARGEAIRMITVSMDEAETLPMPSLRPAPLSAVRAGRRCGMVRVQASLRAAA
jgi:uncharacterized membrane protein YecN with MAPEG domain